MVTGGGDGKRMENQSLTDGAGGRGSVVDVVLNTAKRASDNEALIRVDDDGEGAALYWR